MIIRNGKTIIATLLGAGIITLSMSSAMAANCARMEDKNLSKHRNSANYHHAIFYNSGEPSIRAGFIKTAHHEAKPQMDIVDTAVSAGSFDTLVAAIKAAGLVDTLKGKGPFTVFAPTDEAFAKIPEKDLSALLEDKEALTRVLTYHVVPGKVMAADVVKLKSADTVEGQSVSIDAGPSGVKVNDANVVKTDVMTTNGVIHVIDSVLMPK
jgi:uncharacterized surface protein with fasciclin (FAS1) repeats